MRFLILHLSDIHLQEKTNSIFAKLDKIIGAVRAESPGVVAFFITITGDIAFSGKKAEYATASQFLTDLKTAMRSEFQFPIHWIVIPGNHDCDFSLNSQVRDIIIQNVSGCVNNIGSPDSSILESCLTVQRDFFEFLTKEFTSAPLQGSHQKLHYKEEYELSGKHVRFECYNTACFSQLKERQGQLFYPAQLMADVNDKADVVISLFHHPFNWLEAENARSFKKCVERSSDIILTGHEHVSDIYEKKYLTGEAPYYMEGAVLQTHDPSRSGFNMLMVDIDNKRWKAMQYEWSKAETIYRRKHASDWRVFERSKYLTQQDFTVTKEFSEFLSDAGAEFTHPKANVIRLDDIFVYPDVDDISFERKTEEIVFGNSLFDYVLNNPRLLVIGQDRAGKTALAKQLFKSFQEKNQVPLLLSGDDIKSPTEDDLVKVINRRFETQYGQESFEKYRQIELSTKILIIDDFHHNSLTRKGVTLFVDRVQGMFGRVVILADNFFQLQELAYTTGEINPLLKFRQCTIRELGHSRRAKIMEKWYSLGQGYNEDEDSVADKVRQSEKTIDTLLGKNLFPAYPLYILTILQLIETKTSLNIASGAYAYIYEALITASLAKTTKSITLDTKYTLLSILAYYLFQNNKVSITGDELSDICGEYSKQYQMGVKSSKIAEAFVEAHILNKRDETYTFTYKYLYYYFVAKYFQEHMMSADQTTQLYENILDMTKKVYNEEASNILVFYIYLTKDTRIIDAIYSNAKDIFADQEPCDLGEDVSFLCNPNREPLKLEYKESDPKANREKIRQVLDELEAKDLPQDATEVSNEDAKLNELLKLNVAYKTVEIMGQILRNFPGSLKGDLKLEIARESCFLGLRALGVLFKSIHQNLEAATITFRELVTSKTSNLTEEEVEKKTNQLFFCLGTVLGFSVIKMISYAIGSEQLKETYKHVMADENLAISLIDMTIKLDHFRPIPHDEILELNKRFNSKVLASTILKTLVLDHMCLYETHYKIKQLLCEKLEIPMKPKAIETRSKK